MRRSKSGYKGQMEYRTVCSGKGEKHLYHAYPKPDLAKAQETAEKNNRDSLPGYRDCEPWYVESREIGAWIPKDGTAPRP